MFKIKAGDLVICHDNSYPHIELVKGKEYEVGGLYDDDHVWLNGVASVLPVSRMRLTLVAPEDGTYEGDHKVKTVEQIDAINAMVSQAVGDNVLEAAASGVLTEHDMAVLPNHYSRYKIEPIRFFAENKLDVFQTNIMKYILRHDAKNGMEDLEKARRMLDMYILFTKGDVNWWKRPSERVLLRAA